MSINYLNTQSFYEYMHKDKPIIIKYSALWCNYCRNLSHSYENLSQKYHNDLYFGEVNVDLCPLLEQQAKIEYLPTFIIFQNGKEVNRIVNPPNIGSVELFITEHIHTVSEEELRAFEQFQALILQ